MNRILLLAGLAAAGLLAPGAALAATLAVNSTSDTHSVGYSGVEAAPGSTAPTDSSGHISLRSAIEYATTVGGSSTISVPPGTYALSLGNLIVGLNSGTTITIKGVGTPANTTIHQGQAHRLVFLLNYTVVANVIFNLANVTVSGGNEDASDPDFFGGGGAILAGGSSTAPGNVVTLNNVVFTGNSTSEPTEAASGGAISMTGGGNLAVTNCVFSSNHAGSTGILGGGAIYFDASGNPGNLSILNSTFVNNSAPSAQAEGGAIYVSGDGPGNADTISQCTFTGNSSGFQGGAIYVADGPLTATLNRITGNTAPTANGVYLFPNGAGWVNAANNWWGGNLGPNGTGGDSVSPSASSTPPLANGQISFNPWILLTNTASAGPVGALGASTLTASFLQNSRNQPLTALQVAALVGLPVTWGGASHGNVTPQQTTIQANGQATATFINDGTCNNGSASAAVDHATVSATLAVTPITQPPAISAPSAVCPNSTGNQASGPAGLVCSWAIHNGTITGGAAAQTVTFTAGSSGIVALSLTVANDSGCSAQNSVNVPIDAPPTAGADTFGTVENTTLSVPVTRLLANDSSPIAGPLDLTGLTSPSARGGSVGLAGGQVTYTPAPNFVGADSFTYTLSDGRCTAQGTVTVVVTTPGGPALYQLAITATAPHVTLEFVGVPGQPYVVQWAPAVWGPWTDFPNGAITANTGTGLVPYTDLAEPAPAERFYRTRVGP